MESISEVKPAVGSALLTLGDGNWKMGDGVAVNKSTRLGEGDEDIIIEHFICKCCSLSSDPLLNVLGQTTWSARWSQVVKHCQEPNAGQLLAVYS